MRISSNVVVLLSLFTLAACGGASQSTTEAADPWSGFTGKYSTADARGTSSSAHAEAAPAKKDATKGKTETKELAPEEAAPAKKASKAKIGGESISTIADNTLADASKGALKTKVLSSTIQTGAQYEQVKVQLKGAVVVIIRPVGADTGNANVAAPKTRSSSLAKSEAGYYDEEADVLVLVDAGKKAAAEKALGAILTR